MLSAISSIHKKQIVAITGLLMIGFLLAHLSGNFLIFKGPEALNGYAHFLRKLGVILWVMRIGLIAAVVAHFFFTVLIVIENKRARGKSYAQLADHRGKSTIAVKSMPYTGIIILVFLVIHLLDFTFIEHSGIVGGQDLGLYGLVITTLSQPVRAFGYIIAMLAIGFHLTHSFQSLFQTFGFNNKRWLPILENISLAVGLIIAFGYSAIPVYIMATF